MGRKRREIVKKVKGSPYWHYDWSVDGNRLRGSCGTDDKALAEEIALKVRNDALAEVRLGKEPEKLEMTLSQAMGRVWQEHWQHCQSHETIKGQIRHILRIVGADTPLSAIDEEKVKEFVARRRGETVTRRRKKPLKKGKEQPARLVTPTTVNHELKVWVTCMKRARGWTIKGRKVNVADVDIREHRLQTRKFIPAALGNRDTDLLDALVAHAKAPTELALYTGLRRSNVLGIEWEWIDLDGPTPHIIVKVKGEKQHTVWLIPDAVELLRLLAKPEERSGHVFYFGNPHVGCECLACKDEERKGQPIKSIKRSFNTARKKIGLPKLRFHDLRHDVGRRLTREYGLKVAQQVLGHADIATTSEFYGDQDRGVLATAMADSLSRFGRNPSKSRVA